MHRTKSILTALRRELAWLKRQTDIWRVSEKDRCRRRDLRNACVAILVDSPSDYSRWYRRSQERRRSEADACDAELIRRDTRWWEAPAVQALVSLVELAISDLEACRPFRPYRRCGPLKVPTGHAGDAEHLARGREIQAKKAKAQMAGKQARMRAQLRHGDSQVTSVETR